MVIFFGGYIGSGKTSLAKAVAERLGILCYEVDMVKKAVVEEDPRLAYNVQQSIPFPDDARIKMFTRVVDEFAALSKAHKHIIVDETLHKRIFRNMLYDGAKRYFGGYIVVWIQADEETIRERLMSSQRVDHVLGDPYGMHLSMKKVFEDLEEADIIFKNNGPIDDEAEKLLQLLKPLVHCHE